MRCVISSSKARGGTVRTHREEGELTLTAHLRDAREAISMSPTEGSRAGVS